MENKIKKLRIENLMSLEQMKFYNADTEEPFFDAYEMDIHLSATLDNTMKLKVYNYSQGMANPTKEEYSYDLFCEYDVDRKQYCNFAYLIEEKQEDKSIESIEGKI